MRVILINPKLKTWSPNIYAPLGLAYIASALENEGYAVSILDMNSRRISDNELARRVKNVDIVGITGLVTEYNEVVRLTKLAGFANPSARIILGGPLVTTHTQKVMSASMADYAVIGEGEKTVAELVKAIESADDITGIKGIAYKLGYEVHVNPLREPILDLDTIALPDRRLLEMRRYTTHHFKSFGLRLPYKVKSVTMITSRGCPYGCTMCFKEVGGYKWRARSADNIISEMLLLNRQYGFNGFVFNDDTFVIDRKRVMEFCQHLMCSGLNVRWYCNARVNLMDKEMLQAMAKSGCVGVAYGIESGNQDILNSIKKGITLEQIERVTAETKQSGIHVTGYFMLGILGDTKDTIKQTLNFARKLNLDYYFFTMTSPIQGTPMYSMSIERGLMPYQDLQDWSFHANVNLTKDCTNAELDQFNKDAFNEFTIQKRYGEKYLTNPRLWLDGLRSVAFLTGKRGYGELVKKSWQLIRG